MNSSGTTGSTAQRESSTGEEIGCAPDLIGRHAGLKSVRSQEHSAPAGSVRALAALRIYCQLPGTCEGARRSRGRDLDWAECAARCREDYWSGTLRAEHITELQAADGWHWGPHRPDSWRHIFNALARYTSRQGTAVVVQDTLIDGVNLQAWTSTQRHLYGAGSLPPARADLLESLPGWQWDPDLDRFNRGMAAATSYIARHGTLTGIGHGTRAADFPLGHWIARCRQDHRADTLPAERAAVLEALPGWSWANPSKENWHHGLEVLRHYASQTGHASPPQHEMVGEFQLGHWVARRRRDYKTHVLSAQRIADLELLPGWSWAPGEYRWQCGLAALSAYTATYGHANPARTERFDNYPVGAWARAQRTAHARGRLATTRASVLQALPGWQWSTRRRDTRTPQYPAAADAKRLTAQRTSARPSAHQPIESSPRRAAS